MILILTMEEPIKEKTKGRERYHLGELAEVAKEKMKINRMRAMAAAVDNNKDIVEGLCLAAMKIKKDSYGAMTHRLLGLAQTVAKDQHKANDIFNNLIDVAETYCNLGYGSSGIRTLYEAGKHYRKISGETEQETLYLKSKGALEMVHLSKRLREGVSADLFRKEFQELSQQLTDKNMLIKY